MSKVAIAIIVVAIAVGVVIAVGAVMLLKGSDDDHYDDSDFTLIDDSKIAKGLTTSFVIDYGMKVSTKCVVKSVQNDIVTYDLKIQRLPSMEQTIAVNEFFDEALVEASDFPESAKKSTVDHRGVSMTLYEFDGKYVINDQTYDFKDAKFYVYKDYLIDASGKVDGISFKMTTNVYMDTDGGDKIDEQTDFTLLDESKIAPGLTTSWTINQGYTQVVQYKVESVSGEQTTCELTVTPGSSSEQQVPKSIFFETTLLTVDEDDLPEGYTKTTETHRGVSMTLYQFSGEFDIYMAEYNFVNAKFYVYQGYLWDATCDSATVSGMTTNFSQTADIFMA